MGVSKTTARFLVQNTEQRWVINPGGGGMEDNESYFGKLTSKALMFLSPREAHRAGMGLGQDSLLFPWLHGQRAHPSCVLLSLQKTASAIFQGHQELQEVQRLLPAPLPHQDTHRQTQELTRYPCGGESYVSVQLGYGPQVFGQTSFCVCL